MEHRSRARGWSTVLWVEFACGKQATDDCKRCGHTRMHPRVIESLGLTVWAFGVTIETYRNKEGASND